MASTNAPGVPALPATAWASYGLAALVGAFAEKAWNASAIAISLVIVAGVAGIALLNTREEC